MKCFFPFIILCTFVAPFVCLSRPFYFVSRRDTKEAICIPPKNSHDPFPTFDLDKLQFPRDVAFNYWDWLSDWQLQNDTNVRSKKYTAMFIAKNQRFLFVGQLNHDYGLRINILASNLSVWMADENRPRGKGMLFELDHFNKTTKLKDSTLKYCDRYPQIKKANCTVVDYKNGTNHLNDGNRWTEVWIKLQENRTGVEMFESSYKIYKPVGQWTWNNTNISKAFTSEYLNILVKSHQRNAAFFTYDYHGPELSNNKEMKRKYTKRSSGELCVRVEWKFGYNSYWYYGSSESLEAKHLASERVALGLNVTHGNRWTEFQWNHLDAGEFEFTLRFDERQPFKIDLCQDDDSNIVKTWTSIPKAITKCQFDVGRPNEISAWPSFTPDATLKTWWNLEDWAHVCDRLGIGSNDTKVQIKFCDWTGCNFSKCPHYRDETLFTF